MLAFSGVVKCMRHSPRPHLHLGFRDKLQLKTTEQDRHLVGWLSGPAVVP